MLLSLRIEAAFKTRELDPNVFERCATDLLSTVYPHLVPVTGGSDMGRDADLGPLEGSPRLLATSDKDPMTNLLRGIDQMHAKGLRPKQVVLAISQPASATKRLQLSKAAAKKGVKLVQIFDRTWFVQQLLHSPEWRKRLLSITAPPAALVDAPIELGRRGELLPLAGRGDEVAHISQIAGDLIIVGPPGMGKTRVLAEVPGVAFLETNPDHEQLADDLDEMRPMLVVVEDAVRRPDDLRLLRRLREEETHRLFQVAITVWSDEHKEATDLLPRAEVLQLERLEQREIAAIVRGLGISNYWLLSEIIEQARGRAGWAVALSRVALRGASLSLFHGEALASEVERFLRLAGGSDESLHTLAHVALASGVPEADLPILAKRTQMPLLKLTKILHASTADGILERSWGGWIVEPVPLRAALLHRWFFASVAREPAEVLSTNDDPQLVRDLLEAALAAARYGSAQAKSFAERLIKPMAEKAAAGHEGALALTTDFASIDRDAAEWAMQECILPALTRTNGEPNVRRAAARAAREAAERFLIPSAIKVVLGEALAFTRPDNDPDHPVAILAQAATRILPDTRRQVGRRAALLRPALEWLDEDPTSERWEIVAHLADSLVSPVVSGHWMNAGDPLTVTVAEGAEPVDVMEEIARDIWPEIEKRLSGAPDKAVLPLIHAAGEWLSVAAGAVMPGARVSLEQRSTARRIGQQVVNGLAHRAASSPGLAVRLRARAGRRTALRVDSEFELLASDRVGIKPREAQRKRLERLITGWAKKETPRTLMPRLASIHEQLKLVGHGDYAFQYGLELLAPKLTKLDTWADEAVALRLPAYPIFDAALKLRSTDIPKWFKKGLEITELRPWLLQAALLPGASPVVATEAVVGLGGADKAVIIRGLRDREQVDEIVEALLKHPVREIRSSTAVALSPVSNLGPKVTDRIREAWKVAIRETRPEHLPPYLRHDLVMTLEALISDEPRLVAEWLQAAIAEQTPRGFVDGLDRDYRQLIPKLPDREREVLLTSLPTKGARQAFMFAMRGEHASWISGSVANGTITRHEALVTLHDAPREYFERLAPALLIAGATVNDLLQTLVGTFSGDESIHYGRLEEYCSSLKDRKQPELEQVGKAGIEFFRNLKERALREERRERVYGI